MAVPRPVLLALLGFALIVSALLATRGVGGGETVTAPSTPASKPHPAQPPAQAAKPKAHKAAPAHAPANKHAAKPAPQKQAAPAAAKPAGPVAVIKLPTGVNPRILPVVQALGQDRVVVLFFSQSKSADDVATRDAVQGVRGMKGVSVFNAGIDQLAMYRPILANVGVSQVPAVVVIRPGHKAQLLEGFIDKSSLRQAVADALR